MTKEVKNDITEDEVKDFEEAIDNDEVKDGAERKIEEDVDKSKEDDDIKEDDDETDEEDEEDKGDEETAPSAVKLKEVEGETAKERALRLQVTNMRRERRERDRQDALKVKEPVKSEDDYQELKDLGYDDEQIKTLDKAFDVIGERKGFVKKDQNHLEMANDTLSDFIEDHPEYSLENDKEDLYWSKFNSILKSDYNLVGKNKKQLESIFGKVDRDVKSEFGEKVDNKNKIKAQKQKLKSVSAGASTSSVKGEETKEEIKEDGKKAFVASSHPNLVFKGFDEDEVKEFTK